MLKVRHFLLKKVRSWFEDEGYLEVQAPILIPALGKWANSFEVKYFDNKAYLSNGFLPYGLILAHKLKKVYTITPSFRKEQDSIKHLTEHWRIQSLQYCNLEAVMKIQEAIISYVFSSLQNDLSECFKKLGRTPDNLAKIKTPFNRLTYDQVIDILQADHYRIFWGEEINSQAEKHLSSKFDRPTFIWKYPYGAENLFSEAACDNFELSLCADLIAPDGYGEIASSLQMKMQKKCWKQIVKEMGMNSKDRCWFLSFIRTSDQACSGFAMGVERVLQWICKFPDIREVTAFPRTVNSLYP